MKIYQETPELLSKTKWHSFYGSRCICYYTGILPPRYQIDLACMKFIISLSQNPSANLARIFCYVCSGTVVMYSCQVFRICK